MAVAAKLGGFVTRVLADVAAGSFEAKTPQRAQQLRAILTSLGPSFIKTGQALSGGCGWVGACPGAGWVPAQARCRLQRGQWPLPGVR